MLRPASRFLTLLVVPLVTLCTAILCAAEDDESLRVTISQLADSEAEVLRLALPWARSPPGRHRACFRSIQCCVRTARALRAYEFR